jgi:N-acyl homoserine lactone hydrolase
MRLYAFSCGRIRCRKSVFVPDAPRDLVIDAPMPVFLITHPRGNVLFDTGPHPDVFSDADARWGGLAKAFRPVGDPRSGVLDRLAEVGLAPGDIRWVVNSHLHFDHAGGNQFFPRCTFLVSQKELQCAADPEFQGKGYFRDDWDHPLDYRGLARDFDLFGDGSLVILPMPGHTLGHQVLLVRLKREGAFILSGDSVPCRENLHGALVSRNNMDDVQWSRSVQELREIVVREKAFLIHGHDSSQWEEIKRPPESYG